jgi:hypothetical protein
MARRTKRPQPARPPGSALSISFEPLCTLQCVGLQGCLRNRSEKNRFVQTYEIRSALTIIRRGSLSASRICNEIPVSTTRWSVIPETAAEAPFPGQRSRRAELQRTSMGGLACLQRAAGWLGGLVGTRAHRGQPNPMISGRAGGLGAASEYPVALTPNYLSNW